MKERLLELAKALSKTGIEYQFKDVHTTEEFSACWQKFWSYHQKLASEIKNWGSEFAQSKSGPLFEVTEDVKNPLEVAAIIRLINDINVSEDKIFEDRDDLVALLYDLATDFSERVARAIESQLVINVDSLEA